MGQPDTECKPWASLSRASIADMSENAAIALARWAIEPLEYLSWDADTEVHVLYPIHIDKHVSMLNLTTQLAIKMDNIPD